MTLDELVTILFAFAVAIGLSVWGNHEFGWLGIAVGVPLGFVVGVCVGQSVMGACEKFKAWRHRLPQRKRLKGHFGKYWDPKRSVEFRNFRANVGGKQSFSGIVIATFEYGAFVDIGVGFPALIQRKPYKAQPVSNRPAIGATLTGRRGRSANDDDHEHILGLIEVED